MSLNRNIAAEIDRVVDRMDATSREAVRGCIRAGASLVSLSRYYAAGPLVLIVTVPASWRAAGGCWATQRTTQCTIPAACEAATIAWAASKGWQA